MTRQGPRKKVDAEFWRGRLKQGKDYRQHAQDAADLAAGSATNGNPVISHLVLSAIAYGDAITARYAQVVNQQDHAAAPRLLREVLREKLPDAQERRYKRILSYKDTVQYGARETPMQEALLLLENIREFGDWVESTLA
jgi:hypothetical protein